MEQEFIEMLLCACGCPAMTNSPFCGCCWQVARGWNVDTFAYAEEPIPFDGPVNDSDYASEEMYQEIDSPIQKAG